MSAPKLFIVYDRNDFPVFVGTVQEICARFNRNENSVRSTIAKSHKGVFKHSGIYDIERLCREYEQDESEKI